MAGKTGLEPASHLTPSANTIPTSVGRDTRSSGAITMPLVITEEKDERGLERIRQTPGDAVGEALTGVATPPSSQIRGR